MHCREGYDDLLEDLKMEQGAEIGQGISEMIDADPVIGGSVQVRIVENSQPVVFAIIGHETQWSGFNHDLHSKESMPNSI